MITAITVYQQTLPNDDSYGLSQCRFRCKWHIWSHEDQHLIVYLLYLKSSMPFQKSFFPTDYQENIKGSTKNGALNLLNYASVNVKDIRFSSLFKLLKWRLCQSSHCTTVYSLCKQRRYHYGGKSESNGTPTLTTKLLSPIS